MGVRAGFVGVGRIGRPMAQRAIDAGLDQDAPLELALSAGPPPVIALTPGSAPG